MKLQMMTGRWQPVYCAVFALLLASCGGKEEPAGAN